MYIYVHRNFIQSWNADVNREVAIRGSGGNKLRLYKHFKQDYNVEPYCTSVLNRAHRGALAKFRSGTAPIGIEKDRYHGISVEERTCFNCPNIVEGEYHVLLHCPLYDSLRNEWFYHCMNVLPTFNELSDVNKLCVLLSDSNVVKLSAKMCFTVLGTRRNLLYQSY